MPLTHPPALGTRVVVTAPKHLHAGKLGEVVGHCFTKDRVWVHWLGFARSDIVALDDLDFDLRRAT